MRYSASEKFEIIELVEQSSLSIPWTLAPIGIPRSTVLRLVQPIPGGRDRSSGGWQAETAADLEQDPRSCWTLRCRDEGRRTIRDRFGSRIKVGDK